MDQKTRERFFSKIEIGPGFCWLWTGGKTSNGYGVFWYQGKLVMAHRFSLLLAGFDLIDDQEVDHKCRNHACVNPDPEHLQQVTHVKNLMLGYGASAQNAAKTHCLRGHELAEGNLLKVSDQRLCRECKKIREEQARRRAGKKVRSSMVDVGEGKKQCSSCGEPKDVGDFYKYKGKRRAMCKICFKARGW